MNNKGFTLIELISVISLLVVLALIVVPSVMTFINKNKENSYIEMLNSIESAADVYMTENRYNESVITKALDNGITLQDLIDNGNLKNSLNNPITGEDISKDGIVEVELNNKVYKYTFDKDDEIIICDINDHTWIDIKNRNKYNVYCS